MDLITNNAMLLLEKSLDYTWQKQRITSENIAHAETPGYKAKYLTFEEELKKSLRSARGSRSQVREAINSTKIRVNVSDDESLKLDGNNVNADAENIELARAQIQYEYLLQQMNDQFTRLKTVIQG